MFRDETKCNEMSRVSTLQLKIVGTQIDRSIILSSESVIKWVSEWMGGCGLVREWVDVIDWVSEWVDVGEWVSGCDWLIAWLIDQSSYQASEWVDVGEWVSGCDWLIQWVSEWVDECLRVSRCGLVRVSGCDWLSEWMGGCGWVSVWVDVILINWLIRWVSEWMSA